MNLTNSILLQLASHMQLVQRLLVESGERQGLDVFEVAEGLRRLGHAVTIRSALGGGGGNECLRNLRHRFLTCRMQGKDLWRVPAEAVTLTALYMQLFPVQLCKHMWTHPTSHCSTSFIKSVRQTQCAAVVEGVSVCMQAPKDM